MREDLSIEKVEIYKKFLHMKYWEMREAVFLIMGLVNFNIKIRIRESFRIILKREHYYIGEYSEEFHQIDDNLLKVIKQGVVTQKINFISYSIDPQVEFENEHVTYFFSPKELLTYLAIEGIILPFELQEAAKIYQCIKHTKRKGKVKEKELKQESIIQAFWWKYPQLTNEALQLKIENFNHYISLKHNSSLIRGKKSIFGKLNGIMYKSEKRLSKVISRVKPKRNHYPLIPGLVQPVGDTFAIDYNALYITLNTLAELFQFSNEIVSGDDLLNHPLINMYTSKYGVDLNIVEFILKDKLFIYSIILLHNQE